MPDQAQESGIAGRVATDAETSPRALASGVAERVLLPSTTSSPLALRTLRLDAGTAWTVGDESDDGFLFVTVGSGQAENAHEAVSVEPGAALLVPAGERAGLVAGSDGLTALWAQAGPSCDRHAPLGPASRSARIDRDADSAATGKRAFQVLYDASNGSSRATLFVGYVPPGRAPWHFHQYDEIVWIMQGRGRLHLADQTADLADGAAFRLSPREVHVVENRGDEDLVLLGLFTPAGSPAAAYLADEIEE